VSENDNLLSRV